MAFVPTTPLALRSALPSRNACRLRHPLTPIRLRPSVSASLDISNLHLPLYHDCDQFPPTHATFPAPARDPCPLLREQEGGSVPPSGGGAVGGGGGGGGNRDDDDGSGSTPSDDQILSDFSLARDDLPADVRTLSGPALSAYLNATRNGLSRWLAGAWPGWRRRVAADPDFPFKVLMEETVGLALAASGMIAARGKNILAELDFAFCDIAVGGTLNFILVYLLTPAFGARAGGGALAKLPANLFAGGDYSLAMRAGGFLYKGALFAGCGFVGSLLGTSASQGLLLLRRAAGALSGKKAEGGNAEGDKELPNVVVNSAAWAGFMFVSSNPRYQAVAGMERALFAVAPEAVAKVCSGALRTGNNVLGGAVWVWWARAIGLQKKPTDDDAGAAGAPTG